MSTSCLDKRDQQRRRRRARAITEAIVAVALGAAILVCAAATLGWGI